MFWDPSNLWAYPGCADPHAFPATFQLHTCVKLRMGRVQPFCPLKLRQITLPSDVKDAKAVHAEGGLDGDGLLAMLALNMGCRITV